MEFVQKYLGTLNYNYGNENGKKQRNKKSDISALIVSLVFFLMMPSEANKEEFFSEFGVTALLLFLNINDFNQYFTVFEEER